MDDSLVIPIGVAGLLFLGRYTIHSQVEMSRKRKKQTSATLSLLWYIYSFVTGMHILLSRRNVRWLTDIDSVWSDIHRFHTDPAAIQYIQVSLGYYLYGLFVLRYTNYEPARTDDTMMTIHHGATIILLASCQILSCVPVGILVLVLHDLADPVLHTAKLANYAGYRMISDLCFTVFAVVYFLSRLVYFPYVIWSCIVLSLTWTIPFAAAVTAFLCVLQVLHVCWFSIILRMAYKLATTGEMGGDARSEDDE